MYFFTHRLAVCLLTPFLWVFFAWGIESSLPYPIPNNHSDEVILNEDHLRPDNDGIFFRYFLDTIFTNAGCDCDTNDGCTRGCPLESNLDRDHPLPGRKCDGTKSIRRSNDYCAKHVTGALMAVAHEFLLDHCSNTEQRIHGYAECLSNFHKDIMNNNINICRHGFKFPSAFCMLNLDGQSFSLYNQISSPYIKSKCKNLDRYNQFLLAVYVPFYDGTFMLIPLFKKISPEKYKEFKENPAQIPTGAIIITKLYAINGHVEVKTNREECGRDKNQTCFCSDYCTERIKYHHPVLAVFEWNPEFIHYVSGNHFEQEWHSNFL